MMCSWSDRRKDVASTSTKSHADKEAATCIPVKHTVLLFYVQFTHSLSVCSQKTFVSAAQLDIARSQTEVHLPHTAHPSNMFIF